MEHSATEHRPDLIDRGLHAMAFGRLALGVGSLVSPGTMARVFGVRESGELTYMTRVFGARAIALGLAYLMGSETERTRLRRICLGVDTADTVGGIGHIVRGDMPRPAAVAAVAITGPYAVIGVARLISDLRSG